MTLSAKNIKVGQHVALVQIGRYEPRLRGLFCATHADKVKVVFVNLDPKASPQVIHFSVKKDCEMHTSCFSPTAIWTPEQWAVHSSARNRQQQIQEQYRTIADAAQRQNLKGIQEALAKLESLMAQ